MLGKAISPERAVADRPHEPWASKEGTPPRPDHATSTIRWRRVDSATGTAHGAEVPIGVLTISAGIDVRSADINAADRHVGIRGICPMSFQTSRSSVPRFVGATLTSKPTSASLVSPGAVVI